MHLIRADLHVHTVYSPDSLVSLEDVARIAGIRGIGCIAVTDHDTIEGALRLADRDLPFRLIIGEEILAREGEITGLFLSVRIPGGLGIYETLSRIKEQGGLVVAPHPCDRLRRHVLDAGVLRRIIREVDIIEGFNGRTVFAGDDAAATALGRCFGKPLIAGTDCHTRWELGRCGSILAHFSSAAEFLTGLPAAGDFYGRRAPVWVHLITKCVKYANRLGLRRVKNEA
ncbi:MAG: PHP domain-containing protein [Bacillota bacterium]